MILLDNYESDCQRDGGSELECYGASANYILDTFDFNNINPYKNTVVSVPIYVCLCMFLGFPLHVVRLISNKQLNNIIACHAYFQANSHF